MDTGLYIDITGLALSNTMAPARYNHLLHSSPNNGELLEKIVVMQLLVNWQEMNSYKFIIVEIIISVD